MALTKVVTDGIAAGAVTATQIATNAVTVDDIADGSIHTAKLANDAVTADKLADTAVTAGTYGSSSAIPSITVDAQGRVTAASTSAIDSTAIANGTSNVSVAASGDITFTQAGQEKMRAVGNGITVTGQADISGDLLLGGELNMLGTSDAYKYLDVRLGSNAFTIRGTTGGDAGHETLAQFERNAGASLFYDNVQKLITTSTGINVTGTVSCDGLVCDGNARVSASSGILEIQDSDSTGNTSINYVKGVDSGGTEKWTVGDTGGQGDLLINNVQNGWIYFAANNTYRLVLESGGTLRPMDNNSYDLGNANYRWRNVYTNDLNLSNEGGTNDVDGTWGSWTIQEGEDDLFLLNRRNGKKYKFNLSEVN